MPQPGSVQRMKRRTLKSSRYSLDRVTAPEQLSERPPAAYTLTYCSREVDCLTVSKLYFIRVYRWKGKELLSLTLYDGCCMMNYTVDLCDTEGSVPPSATERGVTNR